MSATRRHLEELTKPGGEFEVVEEKINRHLQRTFKSRPGHLRFLIDVALGHGDAEFVVQGAIRLTYRQAFDSALRIAGSLRDEFGLEPGDRVGILGANAPDWVVSFWAIIALDCVAVPYNAWWTPSELEFGIEDGGTSLMITDSRRARVAIETGFPSERVVVWGEGEAASGAHRLDALLGSEPLLHQESPARGEDHPASLFYTSGTTGRPKGSPNTHRNIISNLLNVVTFFRALANVARAEGRAFGSEGQDVDLTVVPLFHATACLATMIPYVYAGHKLVFMPPGRFDPETAAEVIEQERVTRFGGVPTIAARIVDSGVAERYDFSSVRTISYGGAPASPSLLESIEETFPNLRARVTQGYGLTEASPLVTLNVGRDYSDFPSSVGIAVPTVELRITSHEGAPLSTGETGEIWVKGANVIPGYWNRPETNAETFQGGFFRTGDIGYVNEAGFLFITDRSKDVVIRGGENVYSVEVEAVLVEHAAVVEAAVVGVPHEDLGEEVKAVVVVDPEAGVTADELAEHAAANLAAFKVPVHWELTTEPLPRNPSGKVLKQALRETDSAVLAVGEDRDSAL